MLHLIGLARIPVAVAGGIITAHLYLRAVWWLLEHDDADATAG